MAITPTCLGSQIIVLSVPANNQPIPEVFWHPICKAVWKHQNPALEVRYNENRPVTITLHPSMLSGVK